MLFETISTERRYDIDWIRIMLIFSVFLFHIGMFFNSFGWHVKNNEIVTWLDPIMAYLHRWRMPMLFFVSGVGTYYALGKRTIGQFIQERSARLIIPLVFGMFFIVPPQVYAEKHAQYGSFLNFIPHITEGSYPQGNFSWHHLWFVLYLFICAIAALPIIMLFRSSLKTKIDAALKKFFNFKGAVMVLCIPIFLARGILTRYFPWETHGLVNDWAYIAYSFLFFIYGFILFSSAGIIEQIIRQRRINAVFSIVLTIIFFVDYYYSMDPYVIDEIQQLLGSILEWGIGITVVGYAGKYFNRDLKIRKYLNEAIYPFYILHQTVIIVIAYNLLKTDWGVGLKAIVLTFGSFITCVMIYMLIRPFNVTRVLFGMHVKKPKKQL